MRPHRRPTTWLIITLAVFAALTPVVASARRVAHRAEKAAIVRAVRRAHDISSSQRSSCLRVFVSTVNRNWAELELSDARRCQPVPGKLEVIVHRRAGRWRVVIVASAVPCPIPGGIPRRVQHDLGLDCYMEQ